MNYLSLYANFLNKSVDVKKPLRVVFDCSNGTTGMVLKKLEIPNFKPHILNSKPDGHFPAHGPNPLLTGAMNQLKKLVLEKEADIGIAFDADGDRVFFVDNKGRIVPSFVIAKLLFWGLHDPFVTDLIVFKALEKLGALKEYQVFPSRVGTYYVKSLMRKKSALVSVEFSGHIFFKDFYYSDSGILAAIRVLNALSRLPYSLADFYDLTADGFMMENFDIRVKNQHASFQKIMKIYGRKAKSISKLDGFTFDFVDSFLIVRPSNTEPLLRFFIGGRDKEYLSKTRKDLQKIIK